MPKHTDAEVIEIEKKVFSQMVASFPKDVIVQYCADNFNIGERQAEEYMKRARAKIAAQADEESIETLQLEIRRLDELYRACVKAKDRKTALAVKKEQNKLMGRYSLNNAQKNGLGASNIDLSRLTLKEQQTLVLLLEKAKINDEKLDKD